MQYSLSYSMPDSSCCPKLTADNILGGGTYGRGGHFMLTFTITNPDSCDWTDGSVIFDTPDSGVFKAINSLLEIPTGTNFQFNVDFSPDKEGHIYNLRILIISPPPCEKDTLQLLFTGVVDNGFGSVPPNDNSLYNFDLRPIYPNPIGSSASIHYYLPVEAPVTLNLRDLTGKLLRSIATGIVSNGEHIVNLHADDLSNGSYIVTLESSDIRLSREIMVIH
ncbi:MAG TPA: T9SS type A sorting domain-containing protein [Candidatus Kapabacteria bacterium]|nr:T9SS type A sorting domain-containing protein [Candidatus Kapabacteria bacterium]